MELNYLYEDESILVIVKPVGVPVQPDKTGDESVLEYLQKKASIPAIFLVHRLDRPVGGVMVFAKTLKATQFLSKAIEQKQFEKQYVAVLSGSPDKNQGQLENYLLKNERLNLSKVVPKGTRGAKNAVLKYKVLEQKNIENEILTLVTIELLTGRHHQIRVQFSHIGCPLWGDRKYTKKKYNGQTALFSEKIAFVHPETGKKLCFRALPKEIPFTYFSFSDYL